MTETTNQFWNVVLKYSQPQTSYFEDLLSYTLLHSESPTLINNLIKELKERFSSWNEVRMTTINELSETLEEIGSDNPILSGQLIKKILTMVWESFDDYDLENKEIKEIKLFLEKMPSAQIKSYSNCLFSTSENTPWESNTERVISRYFGIKEQKVTKENYQEMVIDKDKRICHRAIINFAKEICVENPKCDSCELNPFCQFKVAKI